MSQTGLVLRQVEAGTHEGPRRHRPFVLRLTASPLAAGTTAERHRNRSSASWEPVTAAMRIP